MASFEYRALERNGSLSTGLLEARDRSEVLRLLERKALQPLSVKEAALAKPPQARLRKEPRSKKSVEPGTPGSVKLKRQQVITFTEELSDMLQAGLQLEPALRAMENRKELSELSHVTRTLRSEVRDGSSFSAALRKASPSFGPLYCSLAAAGEVSGALGVMLRRQAQYLAALAELQNKMVGALIYPAFLIVIGIGVLFLFQSFLIPQLLELLASTGGELPWGAKLVMGLSGFLAAIWLPVLVLTVVGVVGFLQWVKKTENQKKWDEFKLKLPLAGPIMQSRIFVQFLETLANLVSNGLPLLRALELVRDATTNLFYRSRLDQAILLVGDGTALTRALSRVGGFPDLMQDMLHVGEQTGDLPTALRRSAQRYDSELSKRISRMTALITPIVLIVMAVLIGSVAYMMVTAIFQTISELRIR
ncbi:MAG: type II secretion system F family protein [Verrucomicrobiota bacterium]